MWHRASAGVGEKGGIDGIRMAMAKALAVYAARRALSM